MIAATAARRPEKAPDRGLLTSPAPPFGWISWITP
jgi:hypothetical protein